MLVEAVVVAYAGDTGVGQIVEPAHRGVKIDRWIEQQHLAEVELPQMGIKLGNEGGIQRAQAEAGQAILGDFEALFILRLIQGHAHGSMQVTRVLSSHPRHAAIGRCCDKVMIGWRRQDNNVHASLPE